MSYNPNETTPNEATVKESVRLINDDFANDRVMRDRLTLEQKAAMGLTPIADSFFTDENKRLEEGTTMLRAKDNICPRCGEGVPTNEMRGQYPGALSRTDNLTEICSACGQAEGMEDAFGGGRRPQSTWLNPPAGPGANPGAGKSVRA